VRIVAYRLVWLCTEIVQELESKYSRCFMTNAVVSVGDIQYNEGLEGVHELFQCRECEDARIAESFVEPEDLLRIAEFKRKVADLKNQLESVVTGA
jgi:hypothetical protein